LGKLRKSRKLKGRRLLAAIGLSVLIAAILSVIVLLIVSIKDIPAWNSEALVSTNSTLIYDKDDKLVAKIGTENRIPISIEDLPAIAKNAFLATEDHRFYEHHGIDFYGIMRAVVTDVAGRGKHQGASTITQQLVKLSFLKPDKTFKRKIQEAILAIEVEHYYSKDEILEMYLNKIYFGEGAYGIQAAAQSYFKKDIGDVSLAEISMLAGIPKSPNYYSPTAEKDPGLTKDQPHQSKIRQKIVLQLMTEHGYITAAMAEDAYKTPLEYSKSPTRYPYPYFVDYITEILISKYGENQIYSSGLKVYTTLDPKIQTIAENIMSENSNYPPAKNGSMPQGAAVIMDPANSFVRALVGGREHTSRLGWNRATQKPGRQPGSTFKPIIDYGPAIEFLGYGPATVIDDSPVKYGNYEPNNFNKSYSGPITLRRALVNSVNVVATKLLVEHVTIPKAAEFAGKLGFSINQRSVGASLALGTEEVTPLQMAGAYSAFANRGVFNEPVAILKVEGSDGTILEEYNPRPRQAMKSTTAYLLTNMMESVTKEGTGRNAYLGRPTAGKTGTTDDGKDIWFAGFTPNLVGVVWIGYDQPTSMREAYGGGYPAKIFNRIMRQAHAEIPVANFHRPPGIVTGTVDRMSGLLPGPNTPQDQLVTDLFVANTIPTTMDTSRITVEICATTGLLANEYCPEKVTRYLLKNDEANTGLVENSPERMPTETCTLHNINSPGSRAPAPATQNNPASDSNSVSPDKNNRGIIPPAI
jgi:penicillin-binding protein 1A